MVDAYSGEGLSYVNVHIDHTTSGVTTDGKGEFIIQGLKDSMYNLTFTMIGFKPHHEISIKTGSASLLIKLEPEIYQSAEIVVSASKKSQSLSLAPASVGLVTRQKLMENGTRSFDDAFHEINGIQVTRSSGSNVQALSIRGASEVAGGGIGNRVLLLLDGRPAITPESGGALWNLVPLGAVERIEVIKGAYSSLFGSSAMGGIINVITRTPDTNAHTDINISYGFYSHPPAYTEYRRYGDFYNASATHTGQSGRWSYLFNGAFKTTDGHREKTAYTMYNGFGKVMYHLSPNRTIHASVMFNDINNDTPATWLNFTSPYHVAAFRKDDSQQKREVNADLHYLAYTHARIKYSSRFYYYGNVSDFVFNDDPLNDSTNINRGRQFIDTEKVIVRRGGHATQIDMSAGDQHYLIGGFELQSDFIDGRPDTVLYGRHTAWNIGAYVQDQWMIGRQWTITGGIRYDHYKVTGTFSEGNVSPKIAAVYEVSKKLSFRTLFARAFRNPSIAERFIKFEQGGGLTFRPNPLLRSEKLTVSAELGTKMTLAENIKLDIALFYNRYKDLIHYVQLPDPGGAFLFEVINLNKAVMQGMEVSAHYTPRSWLHLEAGYTYLDAKDASEGRFNDVLPYKSRHTGYFSAVGKRGNVSLMMQARGRSRIEEVFIYPGSEPDGYILLNSRISWEFQPGASLSLSVYNITNKQYEEIERYRMEGRSCSVGGNFSF